MLLFFKAIYREPILSGAKTDTIRVKSGRIPKLGSVVQACVGPSRIFARLRIVAVDPVESLPSERLAQVAECYSSMDVPMVRLTFELVPENA